MDKHWTYCHVEGENLCQGDIIRPSEELNKIIKKIHPYFFDPKYLGYIITTQTCDLIKRGDKGCKADYINLSVIRDFQTVLPKYLDLVCEKLHTNVFSKETKNRARELVARILNQNEQAFGLFYLHEDLDIGFYNPALAVLRVSFSLRAKHYNIIKNSRKGSLEPVFCDKLGWLVGNLYSRVGTPDWSEKVGKKSFEKKITSIIEKNLDWFSESQFNLLKEHNFDFNNRDDYLETWNIIKPEPLKEKVISEIIGELEDIYKENIEDQNKVIDLLKKRLRSNTILKKVKG